MQNIVPIPFFLTSLGYPPLNGQNGRKHLVTMPKCVVLFSYLREKHLFLGTVWALKDSKYLKV